MLKYKIITYGCQMNVHESEKLAGILQKCNFENTENVEDADIVVFNTCCIRDTAEKRALGNIGALKPLKKQKKDLIVAVCGCMPQQDNAAESIKRKFPFIDIIFGTHNFDEFESLLKAKIEGKKGLISIKDASSGEETLPIYRTSGTNAWINIMQGCNNFCTYCIVPYVRGRERSRSENQVLDDIKRALDEGYKEITLLGQNVNSYGNDLKNTSFAQLLERIAEIEGKFRLRFMTSHPKDLNSDIVDILATSPNICKSIHLPIQAGSDRVLQAMNRKYTSAHYLELLDMIRNRIPNCGITTDIMVGFPGETEEDFAETLKIVEKARFLNAFTFIYSVRRGTPAAKMEQVDAAVKRRRISELIKLQNKITVELSENYVGKTYEVLCEDKSSKGEDIYCGRTDSGKLVCFASKSNVVGKFLIIKIQKAKSSALFGVISEDN